MNLRDHLLTLEEELLDPAVRRDPQRLDELLAPNFLEFGSSGRTFTREEIIAELGNETFTPPTLTRFTLLASDETWALVTYRTPTALRSSTWIKRHGRWQMLFHQGTPEPKPVPEKAQP